MTSTPFKKNKIAVIGLGYVGLPLAIEFGKRFKVIAYDLDESRISALKGKSGVSGLCQDSGKYEIIPFKKIKGGKPFNPEVEWFKNILNKTGQRKEN